MSAATAFALDWHVAAAMSAAAIAGFVRGLVGFGSALVLVPALSAVYGPAFAVPLAVILQLGFVATLVPPALPLIDTRRVAVLAVAALLPVPLGAWLLTTIDPDAVRWAIVAIVGASTLALALGWRFQGRPHTAVTAAIGGLSGLLAGATGLPGPPVVFYYLSGRDSAVTIRASFVVFFAWTDLVAVASFGVHGMLHANIGLLALMLTAPYALAAIVGGWAFRRANESLYRRVALSLLVVVALASVPR